MTKMRTAAMVAASFGLAIGFIGAEIVCAPHAALAAAAPAVPKDKQVSPKVGKPLQEALALEKDGKYKDALAKAQEADKVANKTPYETYLVHQVMYGIYAKSQDNANAIKELDAMVASGQMSPQENNVALKSLALTYYQTKNYPKAIEFGGRYLKDVDPNDVDIQVYVAQAQYLQNNFKAASDGIRGAIRAAKAAGKPAQEMWLELLMSAESKLNNEPGIVDALEQLIVLDPKEEYWKNLIIYNVKSINANSTKFDLDVDLLKFHLGLLGNAKEYSEMAQIALEQGYPGIAKKVVDKAQATGIFGQGPDKDRDTRLTTMVNTQAATDQKSLDQGEAQARNAKNGDALVKNGVAYASYGMNDKAIADIQAGIAKGVTNADDANLQLVIVDLAAGKRGDAATAAKAISAGSGSAKLAKLWILAANSPPKKS